MSSSSLIIRQCRNTECSFRFPAPFSGSSGRFCPLCGWETDIVTPQKTADPFVPRESTPEPTGQAIEALLDNIRSTYNVGSMFRAADGAGLDGLHLCGITPTPENPKVIKTALGAEKSVKWKYYRNSVMAVHDLKDHGYWIFALEATARSESIYKLDSSFAHKPILLVVGNEICGVDPEILDLSDRTLWIPMLGQKQSLNVALAFGIAAYTLRFAYKDHST